MPYLVPQYASITVVLSLLIGCFASYVTLELAKRMRSPDKALARFWWMGGALTMGTGIWSMHFVGMFAFSLPIELGYRGLQTFLSWVAAVGVSAIALGAANQGQLSRTRLAISALLMGAGICAMHYIGMAALDMAPGIVWNWWLVAASALIAVVASTVALLIFSGCARSIAGICGPTRWRPLWSWAWPSPACTTRAWLQHSSPWAPFA